MVDNCLNLIFDFNVVNRAEIIIVKLLKLEQIILEMINRYMTILHVFADPLHHFVYGLTLVQYHTEIFPLLLSVLR